MYKCGEFFRIIFFIGFNLIINIKPSQSPNLKSTLEMNIF